MIPYGSLLYFGSLAAPATLAVALGVSARLTWWWVVIISALMVTLQYLPRMQEATGDHVGSVTLVAAYALFEFAIARTYLSHGARRFGTPGFAAALLLALSPLLAIKLSAAAAISGIGFLGLSYVTFRALDVIIGIRDQLIRELPFAHYITFLLFFPTLSSGPLDRYRRFCGDLDRIRTRADFLSDLDTGVQHLFRGLLYKFVLAALLKIYWVDPVVDGARLIDVVAYMYGYTFYLFFDFAGYSAFAIGVGYLLGIRTPENFNRPFLATSIVDFWNRWHISLSAWFRDHVYMRLLMLMLRHKWLASRLAVSVVAFYVSFVLMGLWHGIEGRYLVYGLYHATLLAGYTVLADRRKRHPVTRPRWWHPMSVVVTFHAVCFGLLIFSGRLG